MRDAIVRAVNTKGKSQTDESPLSHEIHGTRLQIRFEGGTWTFDIGTEAGKQKLQTLQDKLLAQYDALEDLLQLSMVLQGESDVTDYGSFLRDKDSTQEVPQEVLLLPAPRTKGKVKPAFAAHLRTLERVDELAKEKEYELRLQQKAIERYEVNLDKGTLPEVEKLRLEKLQLQRIGLKGRSRTYVRLHMLNMGLEAARMIREAGEAAVPAEVTALRRIGQAQRARYPWKPRSRLLKLARRAKYNAVSSMKKFFFGESAPVEVPVAEAPVIPPTVGEASTEATEMPKVSDLLSSQSLKNEQEEKDAPVIEVPDPVIATTPDLDDALRLREKMGELASIIPPETLEEHAKRIFKPRVWDRYSQTLSVIERRMAR